MINFKIFLFVFECFLTQFDFASLLQKGQSNSLANRLVSSTSPLISTQNSSQIDFSSLLGQIQQSPAKTQAKIQSTNNQDLTQLLNQLQSNQSSNSNTSNRNLVNFNDLQSTDSQDPSEIYKSILSSMNTNTSTNNTAQPKQFNYKSSIDDTEEEDSDDDFFDDSDDEDDSDYFKDFNDNKTTTTTKKTTQQIKTLPNRSRRGYKTSQSHLNYSSKGLTPRKVEEPKQNNIFGNLLENLGTNTKDVSSTFNNLVNQQKDSKLNLNSLLSQFSGNQQNQQSQQTQQVQQQPQQQVQQQPQQQVQQPQQQIEQLQTNNNTNSQSNSQQEQINALLAQLMEQQKQKQQQQPQQQQTNNNDLLNLLMQGQGQQKQNNRQTNQSNFLTEQQQDQKIGNLLNTFQQDKPDLQNLIQQLPNGGKPNINDYLKNTGQESIQKYQNSNPLFQNLNIQNLQNQAQDVNYNQQVNNLNSLLAQAKMQNVDIQSYIPGGQNSSLSKLNDLGQLQVLLQNQGQQNQGQINSQIIVQPTLTQEQNNIGNSGRCQNCPQRIEPVCGTNGQVYRNQCLMSCRGVQLAKYGSC